jgi:hypothetical protein
VLLLILYLHRDYAQVKQEFERELGWVGEEFRTATSKSQLPGLPKPRPINVSALPEKVPASQGGRSELVRRHTFRLMFRDANHIDGYVVFDIRRNRFRLITVLHYAQTTDEKRTEGHVYIR